MRLRFLALAVLLPLGLRAQSPAPPTPWPPVATFSILGYDPETGEVGGAVQSRVFSVGNGVLWAEAGVGVAATQAIVDVSYGPQAITLLKTGMKPADVVKTVWERDPDPRPVDWTKHGRQFAVIDAKGNVAAYTGPKATEWAGDRQGAYCTAQGNILAGPGVVDSMVAAFERTKGQHLSLRLLAALEGGQLAGGDKRGMQSAAMVIVKKDAGVWLHNDVVLRLQVDDNPTPIAELRRLVEKAAQQREGMRRAAQRAAQPARPDTGPARPQDPKPPFPYRTTDVTFTSAPNVTLSGTLTVPDGTGPFPAVVLVTGSGPQDRDETLLGHRPFRVLADHLARHGIATLRYDDRGVGRSTGDYAHATTADFGDDAEAAVRFLAGRDEIVHDRIGIAGHSEGGLIAPMVAARSRGVAFVVLLAAPGVRGDSVLALQSRALILAAGVPAAQIEVAGAINRRLYAAAMGARDSADAAARLRSAVQEIVATAPEAQRAALNAQLTASLPTLARPWMRYFLTYDPRPVLRTLRLPVLALGGTLDVQVPARENLAAIDSALTAGRNPDHTTVTLPGLNHLFQTARTGLPDEYGRIEETFAPAALDAITEWITKRFVRR